MADQSNKATFADGDATSAIRTELLELLKSGDAVKAYDKALGHSRELVAFLLSVTIKTETWANTSIQLKSEKLLLQHALGRLRRCDDTQRESLLRTIAMLLVTDAKGLYAEIDESDMALILSNLRVDRDPAVRGQATLASVKYFEAATDKAQPLLTEYVVSRVQKQNTSDLIEAFSAASALFPILPSTGAALFLAPGFIGDLKRLTEASSNDTLRCASLELLSAACTDSGCRDGIAKECTQWLQELTRINESRREAGLAALVLAKTQFKDANTDSVLLDKFKSMMLTDETHSISIEGLAYKSTDPVVKEELASDSDFLKGLVLKLRTMLGTSQSSDPTIFGGLTILHNLTVYQPKRSQEQQKMAQLKAYADRSAMPTSSPLEKDDAVSKRCVAVVQSGAIALLIVAASRATATMLVLISNILSSLTTPTSTRGKIAQQGGFDLAMRLSEVETPNFEGPLGLVKVQGSLSVARVLVKLDPHLLFNAKRPARRAIRPLLTLFRSQEDASQKNLWPVLESLMALTNLASLGDSDDTIADLITDNCWDDIESATLSPALAIRRAAVQCVCNLCTMSEKAIQKYTNPQDKQGTVRMRVLVAFIHEDEDRGVLLSAGAALASLLAYGGAKRFLIAERSIEKTVSMVKKSDVDAQLRALAMFSAILMPEDEVAKSVVDDVKKSAIAAEALDAFKVAARNPALKAQADRCAEALA